jgi:UV DNA damage endonuclease
MYKNKEQAIEQFYKGFKRLQPYIANRIVLENDDKIYNANDVLKICQKLNLPMVLDVHHHNCNNNGTSLESILRQTFDTWKGQKFVPKIHFSSPKSLKDFRSHADNIELKEFINFLKTAMKIGQDFDVMIEAKEKDRALIKLSNELSKIKALKRVALGSFETIKK